MRKYCFDLGFAILLFVFSIFAMTNTGFLLHLSVNYSYILISFVLSEIYLFKSGNFIQKNIILFFIFVLSLALSMCFIDVSFDGRCYHFTLENLFRLGYNPIYDNIGDFASKHNIFYNLVFAQSYPNALELIRSNFYYLFNAMESSKTVNFLFAFSAFFYSLYFLKKKLNTLKTIVLSICIFSLSVLITQINTKMADFSLYCVFILQVFSLLLINKKEDVEKNSLVFIMSSILAIGLKYIGLYTSIIIFAIYFIFNREKKLLKNLLKKEGIILLSSLILCFQPYVTNTIKFHNPFYPSIGHNKLDFMTGQNPKEFQNKPYLYKFVRSMFSSTSDARINNPETPPIFWKMPFTTHFDMPFIQEELRISGFGHLFSGIFIISVVLSLYLIVKKRKTRLIFALIYLTVFLNPLCWWARFVPQLHLLPCMCCYYFRKNNLVFFILSGLILINGCLILKENYSGNAYKTYIMSEYYNNLYEISKSKPIAIYKNKVSEDEDDETILERLNEYGVKYSLSDKKDEGFGLIKTQATISDNYYIKY